MRPLTTPKAVLSRLIPDAAERDPSAVAVRDQGVSITWAEAAERTGRLVSALTEAGVGRGDRVGIHHRKGADGFLAMHAVVQAGAVAVPLDPTASSTYLDEVARHAGCQVLLTHGPCRPSALALAASAELTTVIGLDHDVVDGPGPAVVSPADIEALPPSSPSDVGPDDAAYLITTSGSTGRPKGICHSHRSATAYVDFKLAAYDFGPDDNIADIAPNHFDISTQALWVTPTIGATNVVVPEPHQMLPASLSQLAEAERITVWYSVPYLLTQLLQRGELDERDLSSLRWVLFGGEVFPPGVLAELMTKLPDSRFSNVYGPAEVNACAVHHLPGPPDADEVVPIGAPVSTSRIALVDPEVGRVDARVADGELGEIWVEAPTMMMGYWDRDHGPRQRLGIEQVGPEHWYRTGDLAWTDEHGRLVFAGRVDHQVKVRGHRIELESIEAVLEDIDEVEYAVATVARSADGGDVVIAGVAMTGGEAPDPNALRGSVSTRLPAYAVPVGFLPILSRPTTGSGKLDRRALRLSVADQYFAAGDKDV